MKIFIGRQIIAFLSSVSEICKVLAVQMNLATLALPVLQVSCRDPGPSPKLQVLQRPGQGGLWAALGAPGQTPQALSIQRASCATSANPAGASIFCCGVCSFWGLFAGSSILPAEEGSRYLPGVAAGLGHAAGAGVGAVGAALGSPAA